ncbi:PREDICTED: pre-B lymphocyte protein 3-like [Odobenus rosmarus divergens]|uniref:Pre-B lymphocyte protein 3-like n=1 Tax=Odobenus rosmarus divergens TaxID=9708 RepID=A0A9B0GHF5_ODORO
MLSGKAVLRIMRRGGVGGWSRSIGGVHRELQNLDISVGGSNIYWIQLQPGTPPRDLLYYSSDSDKHQGSGFPGRFSGSKDASANAGLLRISGLQAEAEADSHWATAHSSGSSCRSSQRLREGGSGSKTSGPTDIVSETRFSKKLTWRDMAGWSLLHDDLSFNRERGRVM